MPPLMRRSKPPTQILQCCHRSGTNTLANGETRVRRIWQSKIATRPCLLRWLRPSIWGHDHTTHATWSWLLLWEKRRFQEDQTNLLLCWGVQHGWTLRPSSLLNWFGWYLLWRSNQFPEFWRRQLAGLLRRYDEEIQTSSRPTLRERNLRISRRCQLQLLLLKLRLNK